MKSGLAREMAEEGIAGLRVRKLSTHGYPGEVASGHADPVALIELRENYDSPCK